jgi:hypothetical protein
MMTPQLLYLSLQSSQSDIKPGGVDGWRYRMYSVMSLHGPRQVDARWFLRVAGPPSLTFLDLELFIACTFQTTHINGS